MEPAQPVRAADSPTLRFGERLTPAVGSTSMRAYRHLPKRLGMDRIGA